MGRRDASGTEYMLASRRFVSAYACVRAGAGMTPSCTINPSASK